MSQAATPFLVLDYVFLAILVLSALFGLFRGLVREVLALVGWALAFWAAWKFGPQVAELIGPRISTEALRMGAAYAAVFFAVLIAAAVVGYLIARFVNATGLAATDRILGFAFGLLRGLAVLVLIVLFGNMTAVKEQHWWQQAYAVQELTPLAQRLSQMVPEDLDKRVLPAEQAPTAPPAASNQSTTTVPQSDPAAAASSNPDNGQHNTAGAR